MSDLFSHLVYIEAHINPKELKANLELALESFDPDSNIEILKSLNATKYLEEKTNGKNAPSRNRE